MKIRWKDRQKEVPGIGMCVKGLEYSVPDDKAKKLIKQGLAEEVKKKKASISNVSKEVK